MNKNSKTVISDLVKLEILNLLSRLNKKTMISCNSHVTF